MKKNARNILLGLSQKRSLNIIDENVLYYILTATPYGDINFIKQFLNKYYSLESMPSEFYRMFSYILFSNKGTELIHIVGKKDFYGLDGLMEYILDGEIRENDESIPKNNHDYSQIFEIINLFKQLNINNDTLRIKDHLNEYVSWKLRRRCVTNYACYKRIAIIMLSVIGYDNAKDLLCGKYGEIDYEIIFYLFNELEIENKDEKDIAVFRSFLFAGNNIGPLLEGKLMEIFINFDYFFNSIEYFIKVLGANINRNKLTTLLKERYLAPRLENPELSGDILGDMVSSYHNKYDISDSEADIIKQNLEAYNDKLKTKTKSSIKRVDIPPFDKYSFEMIPLNDARNLVMGYRAGNCFRLNGDAFMLFNNFLTNPHMRLLSISTEEYKDFGMVLLMRNGNVLIAQGIETSKRAPKEILGEKLYLTVCDAIKHIMSEMNEDDEIVASIIGLTNENTIYYNHDILPFIINPLIDNEHSYYNGIDSYQGLVSLKEGSSLSDIRLFVPEKLYSDRNATIWRRDRNTPHNSYEYRMIEKILISLRYARFKSTSREKMIYYYNSISKSREAYTICTLDWYITVFVDGTIDSLVNSTDPDVIEEFNRELARVEGKGRAF